MTAFLFYTMSILQISIKAKEEVQEILISELSELGAEGFEQTGDFLLAYFNENTFRSYEVNELLQLYECNTSIIKEQNWNELWEKSFEPVVVENFCGIRADFHKPIAGITHEIIITPKMSFGTGHHATTYMMIEQMKDLEFRGKAVFDFGTGTGILSILAEKMGALFVLAIDIDPWSIENSKENLERNSCTNISVELSSSLPDQVFDIILANINRNIILQYLPQIRRNMNENSQLLLSGLLTVDETEIVECCRIENLQLVRKSERNNWICLLFDNKK
jgi:ribosomal protein L11 methyltransferase